MKVLVLGSTGMLGSMVFNYLKQKSNWEVEATSRDGCPGTKDFDALDFLKNPKKYKFLKKYDYLINCVGIIKPYCKDDDQKGVINAIQVNALFPHKLAYFVQNDSVKVIQIATDCVYSGKKGKYVEDDCHDALDFYGKSKSLGEVQSNCLLNIRCSIIGPEIKNHLSLLDWFLGQPSGCKLKGFAHHLWNGVTTLQFAQLCDQIISEDSFKKLRSENHVYHYLPNKTVNKYELLMIFAKIYNKDYQIEKVNNIGQPVDRTIDSNYSFLKPQSKVEMKTAICQLKKYMDKNRNYIL